MSDMYLMDPDGSTRPCKDMKEWAANMEKPDYRDSRIVAQTVAGGGRVVSTVFLGLDHGWGGKPLLFETMIFGRGWGQSKKRKPEVKRLEPTKALDRLVKKIKSKQRPNMNDELDGNWQDRYSTIEEARLGHAAAIKLTFDYFPGNLKANKARMNRLRVKRVAKYLLDEIDLVGVTPLTPGTWA